MLFGRKSRPREALAIMWALGQLPNDDLVQGMEGIINMIIIDFVCFVLELFAKVCEKNCNT